MARARPVGAVVDGAGLLTAGTEAAGRRSAGNVTELKPGTSSGPKKRASTRKPISARDLRTPPAWLSAPAKSLWKVLIPKLDEAYPETLSALDIPALALLVEHHAIASAAAGEMRQKGNKPAVLDDSSTTKGPQVRKSPASQVMRDHGKAFLELARDYGLTLRGRVGLDLEKLGGVLPDDGDDGDDLFDD